MIKTRIKKITWVENDDYIHIKDNPEFKIIKPSMYSERHTVYINFRGLYFTHVYYTEKEAKKVLSTKFKEYIKEQFEYLNKFVSVKIEVE